MSDAAFAAMDKAVEFGQHAEYLAANGEYEKATKAILAAAGLAEFVVQRLPMTAFDAMNSVPIKWYGVLDKPMSFSSAHSAVQGILTTMAWSARVGNPASTDAEVDWGEFCARMTQERAKLPSQQPEGLQSANGKKDVNARMLAKLHKDPSFANLSAQKMAQTLEVSKTAIINSRVWQTVLSLRATERAERLALGKTIETKPKRPPGKR